MVARIVLLLLVTLCIGCTHFNPETVEQLAQRNLQVETLNEDMCEDFYLAAAALKEGNSTAWPLFGKARELEEANTILRKQGAACYEADSRDLSLGAETAILGAFKETWVSADEIVDNDGGMSLKQLLKDAFKGLGDVLK